MGYKIRRREQKDCKTIAHVVTIAWQETYRGIVNDEFLDNLSDNEKERGFRSFNNFNDNDNHQFVLEVDDNIVGFIKFGYTNELDYENQGEIFALYIIKEYQGKGFGKKLMETGINEWTNMGCSKIRIGCLKDNPSNEFYKFMGAKFIRTRIFKLPNQELIENVYCLDIKK